MEEFTRGEVIEVNDSCGGNWKQRTYVATIEGAAHPFCCVIDEDEGRFRAGEPFNIALWPKARKRRPDLKVDDRVMVRDHKDYPFMKRHFAGWADDGRIECFADGCTSWSVGIVQTWDEYKLPEVPE